jgi:hypothetical protein
MLKKLKNIVCLGKRQRLPLDFRYVLSNPGIYASDLMGDHQRLISLYAEYGRPNVLLLISDAEVEVVTEFKSPHGWMNHQFYRSSDMTVVFTNDIK